MSIITGRRLNYFFEKFSKLIDVDTILRTKGDASNVTNVFHNHNSRILPNSGEELSITLGKIRKYLSDLKTVAFTGSYQNLSNRPIEVEYCPICNRYDYFTVDNGDSIVLDLPYPGGSMIADVQYLMVIRVKKISTNAFYGAAAKLITVPSTLDDVASGNVNVLNLGATSNTGYTLSAGIEKLTIKASSGYTVQGTYYALQTNN